MCQLYNTAVDDPDGLIEALDPLQRHFMFEQWLEDKWEKQEHYRAQALLIGAFIDPEKVKRIHDAEANTFVSDDEEFDRVSREMLENNRREDMEKSSRKSRRRRRFVE